MERVAYAATREMEEQLWWYAGMQRISERLLDRYVGHRALEILDAGCGTGGAAATWLGRRGRVVGTDLSNLALDYCRQRGLTRLMQASIAQLPFPDQQFDLVTSFDVLYHLWVDDGLALSEFARVLRPGGFVLVRVPANDWLRSEHDQATYTRHRYSRLELRGKLEQAGLRVCAASYANTLLFPVVLAKRLLLRGAPTDDFWLPPPAINATLGHILSLEAAFVARSALPVGLSVVALARKE